MRILVGLVKLSLTLLALVVVAGLAAYLTIRVMTGKDSVEVPDLVGLPMPEALRRLDEVGLRIRIEEEGKNAFDDRIPAGNVLRQSPAPGSYLKQDRRVRVVLSLGRRDVFVPRVVGEAATAAQMRIHDAGLRLGDIVYVPSELVPENVVIDQEPTRLTGTESRVGLLVSSGAVPLAFVMPDLLGRPAVRSRDFLELNGFRVRVETEYYDGVAEGTVVRQKPLAGYLVRVGDAIWLWSSLPTGRLAP